MYPCNDGLDSPRRNNCTFLAIFKTKDINTLRKMAEELGDQVSEMTFLKAYRQATSADHGCLGVDLHPKSPSKRFRGPDFGTYILVPDEADAVTQHIAELSAADGDKGGGSDQPQPATPPTTNGTKRKPTKRRKL